MARRTEARPVGRRPAGLVAAGILWAGAVVVGVATGPVPVALLLAPVTAVAALSGVRAILPPGPDGQPVPLRAEPLVLAPVLAVGLVPLVALAGAVPAAVFAAVALAAVARPGGLDARPAPLRLAVAIGAPALAAGSTVIVAGQGTELAVVFAVSILLFDLGNAVMGWATRTGRVVGLVSGIAPVVLVGVIAQAVLDPPFTGHAAVLLCSAVGLLGAAGVTGCRLLVPGRVPALRRLDSMMLAGPAWCLGVALLLH